MSAKRHLEDPIKEMLDVNSKNDPVLSNKTNTVKLFCKHTYSDLGIMKYIRALMDSGSSKYYLSNFAMGEMCYNCIAEDYLTHSSFNGKETAVDIRRS